MPAALTVHEYDALLPGRELRQSSEGVFEVPAHAFTWLDQRAGNDDASCWLRYARRDGRRAVQVTNHVGVIRLPGGIQIEVLPKIGKIAGRNDQALRALLIRMLACLPGLRHMVTEDAVLRAARMPMLEVFIAEFLAAAGQVVRRGVRSAYVEHEGQLAALRGKLLMHRHLATNVLRADRFYTRHDEFTTDRAENRLLRTALERVLPMALMRENQGFARELLFAMADVPPSLDIARDFRQVALDRSMGAYARALQWARLILAGESPLTAAGVHDAPSLLFPMETVFEAYVAQSLRAVCAVPHSIKPQARHHHLVRHRAQDWFQLRPDLLVERDGECLAVLDTKWKLIDAAAGNASGKYGLSQADFYQLQSYGLSYLHGRGDLYLVYPKSVAFPEPLPVFDFPHVPDLRLWVVPFCLDTRRLVLGPDCSLYPVFDRSEALAAGTGRA